MRGTKQQIILDNNSDVHRPFGRIFGVDNIRRLPGAMVAHVQQFGAVSCRVADVGIWYEFGDGNFGSFSYAIWN